MLEIRRFNGQTYMVEVDNNLYSNVSTYHVYFGFLLKPTNPYWYSVTLRYNTLTKEYKIVTSSATHENATIALLHGNALIWLASLADSFQSM